MCDDGKLDDNDSLNSDNEMCGNERLDDNGGVESDNV